MEGLEMVCYEKNRDVGGTWLENRYPGCACDIPSVNYQFSWKIKLWSHYYSYSPEIWEYLKSRVFETRPARFERLQRQAHALCQLRRRIRPLQQASSGYWCWELGRADCRGHTAKGSASLPLGTISDMDYRRLRTNLGRKERSKFPMCVLLSKQLLKSTNVSQIAGNSSNTSKRTPRNISNTASRLKTSSISASNSSSKVAKKPV